MKFLHHRIECAPRDWKLVADQLATTADTALGSTGGAVYGIWRSQIGWPRDELNAITVWQQDADEIASTLWASDTDGLVNVGHRNMVPTLRPTDATPPTRQGNYAFRFFETPAANWDEFLDLCAAAWPGFEAAYDSQVIGLWELETDKPGIRESLLLTRRPNLAMWERSKLPTGAAEAEVRRKLSRRYDLCDATVVFTTTLLTATDAEDKARWA